MTDREQTRRDALKQDAQATLAGTLAYEETWRECAEGVLALLAELEQAERALEQITTVKRGTPAIDNTIMRRLAREALATLSANKETDQSD